MTQREFGPTADDYHYLGGKYEPHGAARADAVGEVLWDFSDPAPGMESSLGVSDASTGIRPKYTDNLWYLWDAELMARSPRTILRRLGTRRGV